MLCETTETAQFNGMPLSAIRTGTVNQVLAPEEIAMALAELAKAETGRTARSRSDEERGAAVILRLLREEYGASGIVHAAM